MAGLPCNLTLKPPHCIISAFVGVDSVVLLCAASAHCLFARGQQLHTPEYMFQYWGALSSHLTNLKMFFNEDITAETSSALNQLTQLQDLLLDGSPGISAAINFQLPQLILLRLECFGNITISLDCPQLRYLQLESLDRLQEMSGIPDGIEDLKLIELRDGSVSLEQMLPAQGLKHLKALRVFTVPGRPAAVWKACNASRLTCLRACDVWAALILHSYQPPWQDLPCNLQHVLLWLPLGNGIPLVLEQLGKLETLSLYHVGAGPMHLTRPLDPFLDMTGLQKLALWGDKKRREDFGRWTPAALRLLGLADRRVKQMGKVPGGRRLKFVHSHGWMPTD